MKAQRLSLIALSFAALAAGNAFAADPTAAKTREQVRAELAEARATGNIIANSEVHMTERELFPGRYEQAAAPVAAKAAPAAAAVTTGKTRAEVLAELAKAQANGELAALNSDDSARFLRQPSTSTLTRAQVLAELKRSQESGEFAQLNRDPHTAYLARPATKAQVNAVTLAE